MKRSGFRKQSIEEVKAKQASKMPKVRQKVPKATKTSYKDENAAKEAKQARKKASEKGYKPPKWFNAIKTGAHGKTPAQKRLWKVVSDTYRKEDFEKYGAHCPCCGIHFERWQDGQLGHWYRYSLCNGWLKYSRENLALICSGCNKKDDSITNWKLGETLKMRYGEDVLLWIELENKRAENRGIKQEVWMCVDYVARLRPDLVKE
jgi:hypothetical protein